MRVDRTGVSFLTFSGTNRSPLRYYRTSACFGVRWHEMPAVDIWRDRTAAINSEGFRCGVTRGLLGSDAICLYPSTKGRDPSRVISPSKRFCSLHTTPCAANDSPRSKANIAWVHIPSQTGACSAGKPCWCFLRAALLSLVVLTRLSKLMRASSVRANTIRDTVLRVSGCSVVLNEGLAKHSFF